MESLLRFVVALLIGCLASGCTPPAPLRVATNVWTGYESLYLARSLGLYDGAAIRLVEMTAASEVTRALRNGRVEAAALTLDEVLSLRQSGLDVRVVLVMDVSNGADVLMARRGIARLQDLRGRRVGVENSAVGAITLDAALQAAGLRSPEISLVPLNVDEHLSAWRDGRVDALVTFDPVRSQVLQEGGQILFDSSRIPGRIVDVLVVRADAMPHHGAALRALLAGHFAALRHMARMPQDAAARMAPRLGVTAEQVLPQFSGITLPGLDENRRWLAGPAPRIDQASRQLQALMLDRQLLQRPVALTSLASSAYLPESEP